MNKIINSEMSLDILIQGVNKILQLVKLTYGSKGKNILLDKEESEIPILSKQISTITKSISFQDKIKNIPILFTQESLAKIDKVGGNDALPSSFLISYSLLMNSLQNNYRKFYNLEFKNGIKKSFNYLIYLLNEISQPLITKNQLTTLITASVLKDKEISSLLVNAFEKIGKNGLIEIQESNSTITSLETQEGLKITRGYFSPYFVTNLNDMTIELENPYILITNEKVTFEEFNILEILEEIINLKASLLILSPDINEDVLSTLILNKINGILDLVYVKVPKGILSENNLLEDAAFYTKANFLRKEINKVKFISLNDLGQAKKIIITKTNTLILRDNIVDQISLETRCSELRKQLVLTDSDYEKEKLEDRIKSFYGVNALIKVGAQTDLELAELTYRIENAIKTTKSCFYNGLLPGGGISFIHIQDDLESWVKLNLKDFELMGGNFLVKAIEEPFKLLYKQATKNQNYISKNSGIFDKIKRSKNYDLAYDFEKEQLASMYEVKSFDSVKNLTFGLQTFSSLVQMILTIEKIIVK